MTELWLNYRDENGDERRVSVGRERFVIGRSPENDLCIANGNLSRQHVEIEKSGEDFIVSDCNSSNGTTLNGADLQAPAALKDGDVLNLGGGLNIETEIISDRSKNQKPAAQPETANNIPTNNSSVSNNTTPAISNNSSIPTAVFIIAPVLVVLLLMCGGGLLLFFGGENNAKKNNDIGSYYPTTNETPEKSATPQTSATVVKTATVSPSPDETEASPTPEVLDEKKKIEQNAASFLQRIALNDPGAFLKTTQIEAVGAKISPLKGSSALAENFKAVKSNMSQFQSLAQSKGLKPQFLAIAALTEIGNNRGNPIEIAKTMLPIFVKLRVSLANNLADDNLMMIAAYDQGKAGKFKDLRGALEILAKRNPSVTPREIRTIWFLKQQGKITDSEFDFALRFLAIGTIAQNPPDFNVNAEAVNF